MTLAVIQIPKEIAEETLLCFVILRIELDINDEVLGLGCVFEAMVPAGFNGSRLRGRFRGQRRPRFRVDPAPEDTFTGHDTKSLGLVDVVVERWFENTGAVLRRRRWYRVSHRVLRPCCVEQYARPPRFVHDWVVGCIVCPWWTRPAEEG